MSDKSIYLKVLEVKKETENAYSIVLEQPMPKIQYKAGQFFTFILTINGQKVRRSYSASSHPSDNTIQITIKKVEGGLVSNFLDSHLKAGDFIEMTPAAGVFHVDLQKTKQVLLIGGGSGITPLMSIAKEFLQQTTIEKIVLLHCNRNENEIIFHEEWNQLVKSNSKLHVVNHLSKPLSSALTSDKLSVSNLKENLIGFGYAANQFDTYMCGPLGMMELSKDTLREIGVDASLIHSESFISNTHVFDTPSNQEKETHTSVDEDNITLIYNRQEYQLHIPKNKSILEAALDKDIDLPYSCQSGLCTACMGKCTSGKVTMPDCDGLSQSEINQGYVLTCVARPVAPNTVIEID